MKLRILFGVNDDGNVDPLLCWSEYEIADNAEGYEDSLERNKKKAKSTHHHVREVDVEVDEDALRDLLIDVPELKGRVL